MISLFRLRSLRRCRRSTPGNFLHLRDTVFCVSMACKRRFSRCSRWVARVDCSFPRAGAPPRFVRLMNWGICSSLVHCRNSLDTEYPGLGQPAHKKGKTRKLRVRGDTYWGVCRLSKDRMTRFKTGLYILS